MTSNKGDAKFQYKSEHQQINHKFNVMDLINKTFQRANGKIQ